MFLKVFDIVEIYKEVSFFWYLNYIDSLKIDLTAANMKSLDLPRFCAKRVQIGPIPVCPRTRPLCVTSLIGEVGGESEPMLAKLSAASLPGIPMWAGVHTTETECEE